MSVIHLNAAAIIFSEIFNETVMIDLNLTLSEGHTAKLIPPLDWQIPLCYISVIHLKAVTSIGNQLSRQTGEKTRW